MGYSGSSDDEEVAGGGGSIQIRCAFCQTADLDTPERLCDHITTEHAGKAPIFGLHFPDSLQFQTWLDRVEDSRASDQSGYVIRDESTSTTCEASAPPTVDEEGPFPDAQGEYYLLCRPRRSSTLKRRRLSSGECAQPPTPAVSCTAFVHVVENYGGTYFVRYCLEHCGHSPSSSAQFGQKRTEHRRRRTHLKRASSSLRDSDTESGDEDYGQGLSVATHDYGSPTSTVSPRTDDTCDEVLMEMEYAIDEELNNNEATEELSHDTDKLKETSTIESLDLLKNFQDALGELDYESVERFIAERLDTTADKLKAITKVLADLAVDIRACDDAVPQQPLVMPRV